MITVTSRLAETRGAVVRKGWLYWLSCLALILVGLWLGSILEASQSFRPARYAIARLIDEHSPGPSHARTVVTVCIDDQAFWGPELQGRRPIDRTYLARLMTSIAFYRPAVIVLDFDFTKEGEYHEYKKENAAFERAVAGLSREQKLVMPRLLERLNKTWRPLPTPFEILPKELLIRWGFINVNEDPHSIPLTASVIYPNGTEVPYPSLALAAARFYAPEISEFGYAQPAYARFLPKMAFESHTSMEILAALDLPVSKLPAVPRYRQDQATAAQRHLFEQMNGHIVIVGAAFHNAGRNRGDFEDDFDTPAGKLPGYLLHADYIENLLAERTMPLVSFKLLELVPTVLLSIVLVSHLPSSWKYSLLSFLVLLYVLISYVGVVNFGIFIETVIPAILVTAHFMVDILVSRLEGGQHA